MTPPTQILAYLMAQGWSCVDVVHHLSKRWTRTYGIYRSTATKARAHFRIQQWLPSAYWHPSEHYLVSLKCELPTTLDYKYLSFRPQDRPDPGYPLHLDNNRRRNNRRN